MFRVTLKNLMARKRRLFMTTISIALGVGFVAGSFILGDSIAAAFDGILSEAYGGVDVTVSQAQNFGTAAGPNPDEGAVPVELVDTVAAVEGVEGAVGFRQGVVQLLDDEGAAVGGGGAPTFGFDRLGGPLTLRTGTVPDGTDQIAVDASTVRDQEWQLGDTIGVVDGTGRRDFTLVGTVGFGSTDGVFGATLAIFSEAVAIELFDMPDRVTSINVTVADGFTHDGVAVTVQETIGDGFVARTGTEEIAQQTGELGAFTDGLTVFLLVFAGISLFVSSFIIVNTFAILIAQRQREYALLRAVGATSRQILLSVLGEALLIGLVASALGLGAGVWFASSIFGLFEAIGVSIPSAGTPVGMDAIVWSLASGTLVTVAAAILPAWKSRRIQPIEAMREAAGNTSGTGKWRGLAAIVLGATFFMGLAADLIAGPFDIKITGATAGAGVLAILCAAPWIVEPFARFVQPLSRARGPVATIANQNLARDTRRSASTALALTIGVTLVSMVTVLVASATGSITAIIADELQADLVVARDGSGPPILPAGVGDLLEGVDEVGTVARLRYVPLEIDGESVFADAADPSRLADTIPPPLINGRLRDLNDETIFVNDRFATGAELRLGDTVQVSFASGDPQSLTVAGIYDSSGLFDEALVTTSLHDTFSTVREDAFLYLSAAEGVTQTAMREAVEAALEDITLVSVSSPSEFVEQVEENVGQFLNVILALLALAILVALIGIANTMALSVIERTREIGLLRAVGMRRRAVKRMVRWEAGLLGLLGAVVGVIGGTALGWMLIRALAEDGFVLFIPWTRLGVYLVAAIIAGVVAAWLPARRAAKVDILRAITIE